MLVDGLGCWFEQLTSAERTRGRAALFLDRDGVLVEEPGYLGRAEDVVMIPGAAAAVARVNAAATPVVLVTNQAGVARGYYGWDGFQAVQAEITAALAAAGARFDAVLACGFHEASAGPLSVAGHPWRKPAPGMLLAAAEALGLDLGRSWIVGDKAGDLAAGATAGLAGGVHVATGHGADAVERNAALALATEAFAVETVADLPQATDRLVTALRPAA